MGRGARAHGLTLLLAVVGLGGAGALPAAELYNDNVIWGGVPDQNVLNGLWWDSYNAFGPQARLGAFAGWWDFYIPPWSSVWYGPYFSAPHWEPYLPRPINWSGLEYSIANAPPDSTRPHGWYGPVSPGWRSSPMFAFEFWEYIVPELIDYERARVAGFESGAEVGAAAVEELDRALGREPPRLRQYVRNPAPEPGQSPWRARDARAPESPPEPAAPAPRGFTQYYRRTAPGPDQGRWVMKAAAPAPRR